MTWRQTPLAGTVNATSANCEAQQKLREMVANESMSATLAIDLIRSYGEKALEKAEEAKASADEAGKTKIRKIAATPRSKFVKKNAPKLYEAAQIVRRDPGFARLSPKVQDLLESLLMEIDEKEDAATVDPRQTSIDL